MKHKYNVAHMRTRRLIQKSSIKTNTIRTRIAQLNIYRTVIEINQEFSTNIININSIFVLFVHVLEPKFVHIIKSYPTKSYKEILVFVNISDAMLLNSRDMDGIARRYSGKKI